MMIHKRDIYTENTHPSQKRSCKGSHLCGKSPSTHEVKDNNYLIISMFLSLDHAVLFDHLRQLRALARIVQWTGSRHLVSHSSVILALVFFRRLGVDHTFVGPGKCPFSLGI